MRALVIDDSKSAREILGDILREIGFDVLKAKDAREGMTILAEIKSADIVLVDWFMPGMSGLEFIHAVRANPDYSQVPLMMVTTETEMPQVVLALEAGANEYVMKPVTREMILEKLQLLGVTIP
jgi:two-component system, chemotaxis family, chemotaxis protein CheY